jgi:hypothetical protein
MPGVFRLPAERRHDIRDAHLALLRQISGLDLQRRLCHGGQRCRIIYAVKKRDDWNRAKRPARSVQLVAAR